MTNLKIYFYTIAFFFYLIGLLFFIFARSILVTQVADQDVQVTINGSKMYINLSSIAIINRWIFSMFFVGEGNVGINYIDPTMNVAFKLGWNATNAIALGSPIILNSSDAFWYV